MNKQIAFIALALVSALNWRLANVLADPDPSNSVPISYQGQLRDGGGPANGIYTLTFSLFSANSGGPAIAGPVTNNSVSVSNGLFTVAINFDASAWNGSSNWLEIAAATNGTTAFTTLTPRQQVTPAPSALFANTASNLSGALPVSQLAGTIPLAQLPVAVVTNNQPNVAFGLGNNASGPSAVVVGGDSNTAGNTEATVTGGSTNTASGANSTVSGGAFNSAGGAILGYTTVVGGQSNQVSGDFGTLVGGAANMANALYGTQIGGNGNSAAADALECTNSTGGDHSTQIGGENNLAGGRPLLPSYTVTDGHAVQIGGQNNQSGPQPQQQAHPKPQPPPPMEKKKRIALRGIALDQAQGPMVAGGHPTQIGGENNSALGDYCTNQDGSTTTVITDHPAQIGGQGNGAEGSHATETGGWYNDALGDYATLTGGADNLAGSTNLLDLVFDTVVGGEYNGASGMNQGYATVVGGNTNIATGDYATVAGGSNNVATGQFSTVIGGLNNVASGDYATVMGGESNVASGMEATVPGGSFNLAYGNDSMAAGSNAVAMNANSFVWSDGSSPGFASTANEQFLIQATGGVGINKNHPGSALDVNGTITASAFSGNGSGLTGLNPANLTGTVANSQLANSTITINGASVALGGAITLSGDGSASGAIGAAQGSVITPGTADAFVGGGNNNNIGANSPNAVIGGGNNNTIQANNLNSVIAGGDSNLNVHDAGWATIAGGNKNQVGSGWGAVGGGGGNIISNNAPFAVIAGGQNNLIQAGAQDATIAGGNQNLASGQSATVPGGSRNQALGNNSFAAGQQAQALHPGAFVWADSQNASFASTTNDSFNVRAQGGVNFVTSGAGLTVDGLSVVTAAASPSGSLSLGSVSVSNLTLGGTFNLPFPATIYAGANTLLVEEGSTFLGLGAGAGAAAGAGDVGIGDFVLSIGDHGGHNTAVGEGALEDNTSGTQNAALGYLVRTTFSARARKTAPGAGALPLPLRIRVKPVFRARCARGGGRGGRQWWKRRGGRGNGPKGAHRAR